MSTFRSIIDTINVPEDLLATLAVSQAVIQSFIHKGPDGKPWIKSILASHLGKKARGSVFDGSEKDVLSLFSSDNWELEDKNNGVAEFTVEVFDRNVGTVGAISLEAVPKGTKVRVESLGDHPTLVLAKGERLSSLGYDPSETCVATLIVEYSGEAYEKDIKDLHWTRGEPIIASFFPGPALPPSQPYDCKEGDEMIAEEALKKGWKVLKILKG